MSIVKNTIVFALSETINKGIPFLLLPLFTRVLTPEDYGVYAVFLAIFNFVCVFVGLSCHAAIETAYFKLSKSKLSEYIFNGIVILLVTTIVSALLIGAILMFLGFDPIIGAIVYLIPFLCFFQFLIHIKTSLWVAEGKASYFGVFNIAQTLTVASVTIVLVLWYHAGWYGQVIGFSVGLAMFAIIAAVVLYKTGFLACKINMEYQKDIFKFGMPLVFHQLASWIKGSGDRMLLITLIGASATGLFTVGFQLGMVLGVLFSALSRAIYPTLFKMLNSEIEQGDKVKVVKFTYCIFVGVLLLGGLFYLALELGFDFIVGASFQESKAIAKLILISFIFEGCYYAVVGYFFFYRETVKLSKITFTLSIVHLVSSFILISWLGAIGAAWTLVFTKFIQFIAVWYYSNKIYPLPWFFISPRKVSCS